MNLNKIIELCTIDVMSLTELSEDSVFCKIPKGKVKEYIDGAASIARKKAEIFKNGNNKNLIEFCKHKGVTVNIIDANYEVMKIKYRADIYYDKKQINIIKPSILEMYNFLEKFKTFGEGFNLTIEKIIDIHIAHELYHLIEYMEKEETGKLLPKVTTFKIGKYERKVEVTKTSEVAAHIFCMEVLNLPYHPRLLDFLYLLVSKQITEVQLINYLINLKKLL